MIYTKHVANSLNVIKVYFNEVTYCSTNYRDTSTIIMKYKLQQNYKGMIWQRPNEFNTIFRRSFRNYRPNLTPHTKSI